MNFTGFKLWSKNSHNMLMLLNAGHAREILAFDTNLVMVMGAGQVKNLDVSVRISLGQTVFYFLRCHRGIKYQKLIYGASAKRAGDSGLPEGLILENGSISSSF